MEYHENRLCISARELVDGGIVSQSNYQNWVNRKRIDVVRRGGGASGHYALVAVESLPRDYRAKVQTLYPDGDLTHLKGWVCSNYETDQAAVAFFHSREQAGLDLPPEKIKEYVVNASVLNCCIRLYERAATAQKLFGGKYNWEQMAKAIEALREEYGHTLPASTLRFRKKVNEYKREGYACLISGKFGNQSARRVTQKVERLVLSIAVQENQPYNKSVWEQYIMFITGELDVWSYITGELYNPDDFVEKDGSPLYLSESTINNILNKPNNKMLIEQRLRSRTTFMHEQMPHVHRHSGNFSLSQISMDDVDLKRRMPGNKYVHVYRAWDVVSQCIIGVAYSRGKDQSLVVDCFRDMFRLCAKQGWGMPAGLEVENHLMTQYRDGFLQAGVAFSWIRYCAPQNSQEKYAEPMNGAFQKFLHDRHEGQGRFYGKGKNRIDQKKVSDDWNHTYEDKKYYEWDELLADDRVDVYDWNHLLHPNQKKYPGMTRWDVLCECLNPSLQPLDQMTLARYIGERVETSIRRNSTVRVAYEDWWLSDTSVLERLKPNDYKVTAYYMPDGEGKPTEVHIFQGDKYIDTVEKVETFNRVMAEQTDDDVAKFIEQQKKISKFSKYVRDHAIEQVGVMKKAPLDGKTAEHTEPVRENRTAQEEPEELEAFAVIPQHTEQEAQPLYAYKNAEDRGLADI